jgi:hypothetical protein
VVSSLGLLKSQEVRALLGSVKGKASLGTLCHTSRVVLGNPEIKGSQYGGGDQELDDDDVKNSWYDHTIEGAVKKINCIVQREENAQQDREHGVHVTTSRPNKAGHAAQ